MNRLEYGRIILREWVSHRTCCQHWSTSGTLTYELLHVRDQEGCEQDMKVIGEVLTTMKRNMCLMLSDLPKSNYMVTKYGRKPSRAQRSSPLTCLAPKHLSFKYGQNRLTTPDFRFRGKKQTNSDMLQQMEIQWATVLDKGPQSHHLHL